MKKILSALLSISLLFALSAPAFAVSPIEKNVTATNEFDAILMLGKMTDNELTARGYDSQEIATVRNAASVFDDHIEFLATMSEENLSAVGYSPAQIRGIKSYDPATATNSTRSALSGECITTSTIDNYTGTSARVTSEFEWVGIPAFKMTDVLITVWNNWQLEGKTANVKYTHIYGTESSFWQAPTYQPPESGMTSYGSGYNYPAALQDNYFYASEGFSIFTLSRQSSSHLETTARVSHQQFVAGLAYGISGGLDISISLGRVLLGEGHDEKP